MDLSGGDDQAGAPLPSMDLHGEGHSAQHGGLAANPLPSMELYGGDDAAQHDGGQDDGEVVMDDGGDLPPSPESAEGLADPLDPLQEQPQPQQHADGPAQESMRTAFDVWQRLVEDAQNVQVKNLTFTEVVQSRSVKDVLPALARIHARLRHLGLPLLRIHCDRGQGTDISSGSQMDAGSRSDHYTHIQDQWTSGGGGGCGEASRAHSHQCKLVSIEPLAIGFAPCWRKTTSKSASRNWMPAAPLLKFGTRAFALKKSWQDRYHPWRDTREEVIVMGPDKCSSLTTTNYYVKSVATGRFFFTDDVVEPVHPQRCQLNLRSQQFFYLNDFALLLL